MIGLRRMVIFGVFAAAAGWAGGQRAEACLMEGFNDEVGPARAERLLVMAREHTDKGEWDRAAALVRRVASSSLVKKTQLAEALAVIGWSAWVKGRPSALGSMRRARRLDDAAVEGVLARARAPQQVTALRAALAG
jgi:hypothetical protein